MLAPHPGGSLWVQLPGFLSSPISGKVTLPVSLSTWVGQYLTCAPEGFLAYSVHWGQMTLIDWETVMDQHGLLHEVSRRIFLRINSICVLGWGVVERKDKSKRETQRQRKNELLHCNPTSAWGGGLCTWPSVWSETCSNRGGWWQDQIIHFFGF